MKKALIFGLGRQGSKYIEYFSSQGYLLTGVSKSGDCKNLKLDKIYSFSDMIGKSNSFFLKYSYIIISVQPYLNQEEVIQFLLKKAKKQSIIIEKPVSYNIDLLYKLRDIDNIYFYIDEFLLSPYIQKLVHKDSTILLTVPGIHINEYFHIIEHAMAPFLCMDNFEVLLENFFLKTFPNKGRKEELHYHIFLDKKYYIHCNGGNIFLNNKKVTGLNFYQCISFYLENIQKNNRLYKKNFIKLRRHLFKG